MPQIRLIFLWHMHQPFYKDLVTGEYRLPWVRLHALKDYYGMVKLLDEYPAIHQTFNLVPSLVAQIQDYADGMAKDPFLDAAAKPAAELSAAERRFILAYLFQANAAHLIARYPRYEELYQRFRASGENPERALARFEAQDFTDLQVLSQLAWFDEFFLQEPEAASLVRKGRNFDAGDQRLVISLERELISRVLLAYAQAARKGAIEISASPFYHPILPLLCDTGVGAVSTPGLKLPQQRFRHPEDARDQLMRGLDYHEKVFGVRPRGAWPSEGSISEEVLRMASALGLKWLASDEGVLARSLNCTFSRNPNGTLQVPSAERLFRIYSYEGGSQPLYLLFRDRLLSDLIGFVYSGMPPGDAAQDFVRRIHEAADPVIAKGRDAVLAVILDGENAWEYYPRSGREFLRRLYDAITRDPQIRAVTVGEAIQAARDSETGKLGGLGTPAARQEEPPLGRPSGVRVAGPPGKVAQSLNAPVPLSSLVPGSWINSNFNVWIGAPEDNRSWDYLSQARDFYAEHGMTAAEEHRSLAYEEILIAEGSDWNWWYGPEHHSANDRDFDELYRKHLSNVYLALGSHPPDYLAQPIAITAVRPVFQPQTAYIHPHLGAEFERYFDWIGAAVYSSGLRAGAMHGKQFLFDAAWAGIDEQNVYGRLDFTSMPEGEFEIRVNLEFGGESAGDTQGFSAGQDAGVALISEAPRKAGLLNSALTLEATAAGGALKSWRLRVPDSETTIAASGSGQRPTTTDQRPGDNQRPRDDQRPPDSGQRPPTTDQRPGDNRRPVLVFLRRNFTFQLPLTILGCAPGSVLRVRFAVWRNGLPQDALPLEGWIPLRIAPEDELAAGMHNYSAFS
jgi:alpha-amylase/alpha-mannosidase (GH57 family)